MCCVTLLQMSQMRLHYCTEERTPKQVVNKHIINMEPAGEQKNEETGGSHSVCSQSAYVDNEYKS